MLFLSRRLQVVAAALLLLGAVRLAEAVASPPEPPGGVRGQIAWERS